MTITVTELSLNVTVCIINGHRILLKHLNLIQITSVAEIIARDLSYRQSPKIVSLNQSSEKILTRSDALLHNRTNS
jgi:hypothetical protein